MNSIAGVGFTAQIVGSYKPETQNAELKEDEVTTISGWLQLLEESAWKAVGVQMRGTSCLLGRVVTKQMA